MFQVNLVLKCVVEEATCTDFAVLRGQDSFRPFKKVTESQAPYTMFTTGGREEVTLKVVCLSDWQGVVLRQ